MNNRLKQFLAAENITQAQFADRIHVVRASVSHILSGRNNPSYDFIKAVMRNYPRLNMEWLILGRGKMYKNDPEIGMTESRSAASEETELQKPTLAGSLFADDELMQDERNTDIPASDEITQISVNKRRIQKIIILFDDGLFQEIQ